MTSRGQAGVTLVEALAALAILGFVLLASMAIITWAEKAEGRAARRVVALELAASLAERVRVAPYPSLASGDIDLSSEYIPLPEPQASLDVTEDEQMGLKRVIVIVVWGGDHPGRVTIPTAVGSAAIYR